MRYRIDAFIEVDTFEKAVEYGDALKVLQMNATIRPLGGDLETPLSPEEHNAHIEHVLAIRRKAHE